MGQRCVPDGTSIERPRGLVELTRPFRNNGVGRRPGPAIALAEVHAMRLAFSTNAYLRFPFDEAADRIASFGYAGLELMADVPHAWPAGLLDGPKRAILAALERNRLSFSNVNAFMMNAINDARQPYWSPSFIEPEP